MQYTKMLKSYSIHEFIHNRKEHQDGMTEVQEPKMSSIESNSHVVYLYLNRKGSNCSTPISATVRSEYDYPSSNFVRTPRSDIANVNITKLNRDTSKGIPLDSELSIDEGARLQIRLHYNPVMDEWVR